jgi:hypothetical protein
MRQAAHPWLTNSLALGPELPQELRRTAAAVVPTTTKKFLFFIITPLNLVKERVKKKEVYR